MKNFIQKFFNWYEKHYRINVLVTASLFSLQLVHLYWLTTSVVLPKAFGIDLFPDVNKVWELALILVDYTEIPALITASLLYISHLRKNKDKKLKNIFYLFAINIQFVHILWITDEYVIKHIVGHGALNWYPLLAWIAIGIDYLELPVIFETIKKAFRSIAINKNL